MAKKSIEEGGGGVVQSFYGQADCKGGEGKAVSALTICNCENPDPLKNH